MPSKPTDQIDAMLHENRVIEPPAEFVQRANMSREQYNQMYRQSLDDPETFWSSVADELHWMKPHERVLDWREPHAKWFVGAQTNMAYNALDRNVERGFGNKKAIISIRW